MSPPREAHGDEWLTTPRSERAEPQARPQAQAQAWPASQGSEGRGGATPAHVMLIYRWCVLSKD